MRKIIASLHISLDGFAAGPDGEMDWIKIDDQMFDDVKTITDNSDTALYGRVTWQMMEAYWPKAGEQPNAGKHDKEHSEWYNKAEKIVISNSMKGKKQDKTTFIAGDIPQEIQQLKQRAGKDIVIFGSPSVVRILMWQNLIDEYRLFVNPVILGKGISIFGAIKERLSLKLINTRQYKCGVAALQFETGDQAH
jgi:dihydrofolate reductase